MDDRPSALVLEIPAAEAVVGETRGKWDPSSALGVPAHVTVLFPFLDAAELTDAVRFRLAELFAAGAEFELVLDHTAWFGDDVLYLAPADPSPVMALTQAVTAAFPSHPPYGGEFDTVVPHLTIAQSAGEQVRRAESGIVARLPIRQRIAAVTLLAQDVVGGPYREIDAFPLGTPG